ncbi:MAG: dihydropteroate synthase [Paludibacteraceae bacterium]|nr:dihydropteroate synthase [Paludibacteraceae bacterium]
MADYKTINCRGKIVHLDAPIVMGIVNITPDSFFEGSRYRETDAIKKRAEEIVAQGGKIIDVGGFSTRPGAADVSEQEELDRVCMAVEAIRAVDATTPISVDTFRSKVALESIGKCGADIINDISGGLVEDGIFEAAATLKAPYILMHTAGHTVQEMQQKFTYNNITKDIFRYFAEKISKLHELGVNDIILDPGFGFAKDIDQNYELMAKMSVFKQFDLPILVGISRKRMIWQVLESSAKECLNGVTALNMVSLQLGADILRVHDVKEAVETVKLYCELQKHASVLANN